MGTDAVLAKSPSLATPEELKQVYALARTAAARERTVDVLARTVDTLRDELAEAQQKVVLLTEQNNSLLRRLYAPKSEKSGRTNPAQLSLFDSDDEPEHSAAPDADGTSDSRPSSQQKSGSRRGKKKAEGTARFPADLPRVEIVHELPEEERRCARCGDIMQPIGQREFERLRLIPARVEIERHIVYTYGCAACSAETDKALIVRSEVPPNVIPKSFATPQAVACLAAEKFQMALPYYRMEARLAADGIPLSRQTMANWLIQSYEFCLRPLLGYLHKELLSCTVLHADETPIQVLKEPDKKAQTKSYMWLYAAGSGAPHPILFYEYQPDRAGIRPREFLEGFSGYLQTDGYAGYHNIPNVTGVACAAHMRRKFNDALMALPESKRAGSLAEYGQAQIDKLFALEREFAELSFDARKAARAEKCGPVLAAFREWLARQNAGKSKLGTAIRYSLAELDRLSVYLQDGRIALSNNYAERHIKPIALGRKNWLFANTPQGARTAAGYFTIIETAKDNGVDPYRYLVWIFTEMPKQQKLTDDVLESLMPWNAPEETRSHVSSAPRSNDN